MEVKLIAETVLHAEAWDPDYLLPYVAHDGYVDDPDELAEIAGRLCYKSWNRPNPKTITNTGYIANIIKQQHFSVLEHASATFWISGVSRTLTHELVRHRHFSYSQVSQRYVHEGTGEDVTHPALREGEGFDVLNSMIADHNMRGRMLYKQIVRNLMDDGCSRKTARGAARGVLSNATSTEIIVTGNHRAFREFLHKRLSPGADEEIRELAQRMLIILKGVAPATYQDIELTEENSDK